MLSVKHLNKKFGTKTILDNVSFDVEKGGIVLLLGQSGVGKSTLLRILSNLETMDSGTILLDNKELSPQELNKNHAVGMVFQQFNLFEHLTVEQNITLALEKVIGMSKHQAQERAQQLLKHYGLAEKAHNYPSALSGGQKQRLAIARALALKPDIICMDEPTSALDPLLTTYVAQNIQELAQEGYSIIVASHDIGLLERLDCTIHLMHDGKIIETASSSAFKKNKEDFARINKFVMGHI